MADATKMPSAGVTASTPERIMLGAGVYAKGLPIDILPTAEQVLREHWSNQAAVKWKHSGV